MARCKATGEKMTWEAIWGIGMSHRLAPLATEMGIPAPVMKYGWKPLMDMKYKEAEKQIAEDEPFMRFFRPAVAKRVEQLMDQGIYEAAMTLFENEQERCKQQLKEEEELKLKEARVAAADEEEKKLQEEKRLRRSEGKAPEAKGVAADELPAFGKQIKKDDEESGADCGWGVVASGGKKGKKK